MSEKRASFWEKLDFVLYNKYARYRRAKFIQHDLEWKLKAPYRFYQRGRYGVSYTDAWNLGDHLSRVLVKALPTIRDGVGWPGHVPLDPEAASGYLDDPDDEKRWPEYEDWQATVQEMIDGFTLFNRLHGEDFEYTATKEDYAKMERAFQLLGETFPHLWD